MRWQRVYVFISSTFNDMHAERDFLVKRVFPELRLWCKKRKIQLIDVDLRWGVSEKDAAENKKVVDICLKNIDKCRPFFLCFLGQRRGWIPMDQDINSETMEKYPGLERFLGHQSITELEIIHALLEPMTDLPCHIPNALFYFRDPGYLTDITEEKTKGLYASLPDAAAELEQFKENLKKTYPTYTYEGVWDETMHSPELDGVGDPVLAQGRLKKFTIQEQSLADHVIQQLKQVITAQYPDRTEVSQQGDDLDQELDHQDGYLFSATESYIERPEEEDKIRRYLYGQDDRTYILEAEAGSGKTSLLAHILNELPKEQVLYRFVGTSQASSDIDTLLRLLYQELQKRGMLEGDILRKALADPCIHFQSVLTHVSGYKKPLILVLDAIDQFDYVQEIPYWIPVVLPEGIRLIISLKTASQSMYNRYFHENGYGIYTMGAMSDAYQKRSMIEGYLGQFLKTVDDDQLKQLIAMEGSSNPLYLKIVLNELRIHGSFESLSEKLGGDYGNTPVQAFEQVLKRMEQEQFLEMKHYRELFLIMMTMTAFSREGIDVPYYSQILVAALTMVFEGQKEQELADAMYVITKHLSPYMIMDGTRIDFLYDSFRQAVIRCYSQCERAARYMLILGYRIWVNSAEGDMHYAYGKNSDLISLLHHDLHYSLEETETELLSPWFVIQYCKKNGAASLAEAYYKAAALAGDPKPYEELGDALISIQANVAVYPNTVLYELRKRLGADHPLLSRMWKQVGEIPGQFFERMNPQTDCIRPHKELLAFQGGEGYFYTYFHDGYVSFIRHNTGDYLPLDQEYGTVVLQSLVTGKVEKMFHLRRGVVADYGDMHHLYFFYKDNTCEILDVPSLSSIYYGEVPTLPEGFHWHLRVKGYEEEILGMCSNNNTGEQHLLDLKTGQILCSYQCSDNEISAMRFHWSFYDRFMFEKNKYEKIYRLVDLKSGQEIYRYEGEDLVHFVSDGRCGYWIRCNREHALVCYVTMGEDGYEVGEEKEMIPRMTGGDYAVADGYLLAFSVTQVWVYDSKIQCLGYKNSSAELHYSFADEMVHRTYGRDYVKQEGASICFYNVEAMLEGLVRDDFTPRRRSIHGQMIRGDYLYLFFGSEIDKIHLDSHQVVHDKDISVNYNTKVSVRNRYGRDMLLGFGGKCSIVLKNQSDLRTRIRYRGDGPDGMVLDEAYYVNGKVGLVFSSGQSEDLPVLGPGEEKDTINVWRYRLMETEDFETFDTWDLDIKSTKVELFESQGEYYLWFPQVYVDETHYEVRIYHIGSRSCVCSLPLQGGSSVYDHNSFIVQGKVYVCVHMFAGFYKGKIREHTYHLFEMDPVTGNVRDMTLDHPYGTLGYSAKEAYLSISDYDGAGRKVLILSLETGQVAGELLLRQERAYEKKVIRKYGAYLVYYGNGILDVYGASSGKWIFGQMLESGILLDRDGTGQFVIVSEDGRYHAYRLQNIKNMV